MPRHEYGEDHIRTSPVEAILPPGSDSLVIQQSGEQSSEDCEQPNLAVHQAFSFPGVLTAIPEAREAIMKFVIAHCADEGDQIEILIALQEALANAALHGCKDDPAKRICCEVSAQPAEIVITVRDQGPGFRLEHADPNKFEATKLTHGRGIALMRSLMAQVSFARNGAEVVLRKQLQR